MSVISEGFHKNKKNSKSIYPILRENLFIKFIYTLHHSRTKVSSYYSELKMLAREQVTPYVDK